MKIYPFKALYPNTDLIASPESFFDAAGKEFIDFRNAGFFTVCPQKAIFIYRIDGENSHTGIIASNDISDLEDKKILGHENTITEKEQTMLSLMLSRKAMIKPVLVAYQSQIGVNHFVASFITLNAPFFSINLIHKKEKHTIWAVSDEENIGILQQLFTRNVSKAYIADGHHRAAITARLVTKKYLHDHDDNMHPGLLTAFFPFSELTVHEYNRVVDFGSKMSTLCFLAELSVFFNIARSQSAVQPTGKHELTLYLQNEWFVLRWKAEILSDRQKDDILLDVDLFNDIVLTDILNIIDIKTATEVRYVEGVAGGMDKLINMVKEPNTAGFCFFPVSAADIITVSDAHDVLPPKSTWFEPRMKNGLLIKEF
jgi:uncharacterized protein (DUF1015 family)